MELEKLSLFDASSILKSSAKNAVIFAMIWGAWAWWINSAHGNEIAWRAANEPPHLSGPI